jgi:dTDP-4-amino-4,6-dideoxygalactose transaminase
MTKTNPPVSFSVPRAVGRESDYVAEVIASSHWGGGGKFTALCAQTLMSTLDVSQALITHSCTAALEMAAILAGLKPGDEVIMPSFTFVSTANAVVLRGATPVFVDIRTDTLNIDETLIEAAITERTRAIIVVHYAGVCCEMDAIAAIAQRHGLLVIEDAAHAYLANYRGRPAGGLGDMGAISFHETKNITSGEGGAFTTRHADLARRAEIVREKGTDRSQFLRGEVARYSWVDVGSSYAAAEIVCAVLYAQLEMAQSVTARRIALWNIYHDRLAPAENAGRVRRPIVPDGCLHNGHIYYLLLNSTQEREAVIGGLRAEGITAPFHYVPLHAAPAGRVWGRASGNLGVTTDSAARLVRLPLHGGLIEGDVERVAEAVTAAL